MAVDNFNKKGSLIGLLPEANSSLSIGDKKQIVGLYNDDVTGGGGGTGEDDLTIFFIHRTRRVQ